MFRVYVFASHTPDFLEETINGTKIFYNKLHNIEKR